MGARTGSLKRVKKIFDELNSNDSKALESFRAGISGINLNDKIKPPKAKRFNYACRFIIKILNIINL